MDAIKPRGQAGGLARAESLPAERKREIGKKAAAARWGGKPPTVAHKGSFKDWFGIDAECYVLNDANKTAVISQKGMARVLGLTNRGNAFPKFVASQGMSKTVGAELKQNVENTVRFQLTKGGAEGAATTAHGYDAALLIDICQAIIAAGSAGHLKPARYQNIIKQAHVIVGASAKSGITRLVYDLSGYSPSAEEAIAAFKAYVQEEAKKYESEFPNELYMEWHRLYNIPIPVRGKPWHFKHLTVRHIYYPLAKSSGKILTLLRATKAKEGDRQKKLFQFLNDVGARALRMQLGRVLEMAESSPNEDVYENKIVERFGGQTELGLVMPIGPIALPPPSSPPPPAAPAS